MVPKGNEKRQRELLVGHFLDRFFDSELVPRQSEARITLIQILAVLAFPGLVISVELISKYSALYSAIATGSESSILQTALNDKCWFLYFSMVVMGFVTVLEWDSLFPDRRDYLILSPLPIAGRTFFAAKVKSLFLFLLLFSLFVNLLPALLFPLIAGKGSLIFLGRFIFSHVVSVFAGNAFVFLSLIAAQGLLMNVLGPGSFRKASRLFQFLLLVSLLTVFFLMPVVPFDKLKQNPRLLVIFPPAWFLGLYETLLRGRTPEFAPLAGRALGALALAGLGFAATYLASYKRQVRRVLEGERIGARKSSKLREMFSTFIQRVLFRNPAERAVFNFIFRTLLSDEKHRVYLGAYIGVGVAFVAMGVITLLSRHGYGALHGLHTELLSITHVLIFFVLVGMRVLFALPSCLGANWIFRLTEQADRKPYLSGVHKVMVLLGVVPVLLLTGPWYVEAWGWQNAVLHELFSALLALLLIEILIFRLDKIPFTCTYLPGKANLRLMFLPYLIAFLTYAYSMSSLERRFLQRPAQFAALAFAAALLLSLSVRLRNRKLRRGGGFIYEVASLRMAEPLNLSR